MNQAKKPPFKLEPYDNAVVRRNGLVSSRTVCDLAVACGLLVFFALLLPALFRDETRLRTLSTTLTNLKRIGVAGYMYAYDSDDTMHPVADTSASPNSGYYVFLRSYIGDDLVPFDAAREIPDRIDPKTFAWTNSVTLSVNRNGWLRYEGPPPSYGLRQPRRLTSQFDPEKRAAYATTANYDPPTPDLQKGYNYFTEEAGCAVVKDPTRVKSTVFNRVYLATRFHLGSILASFGDTHAAAVPFKKVGSFQNNSAEAEDCAGYGTNRNDGLQPTLDLSFWGVWDDPVR